MAARIAALASTMLDSRVPIAVGRTERTATPAQRRALAARDKGCIIPGCGVAAEACQVHHVTEWSAGGPTDPDNLVLLCWTHHRQVDLLMWTIHPADPLTPVPEPEPGSPPGTHVAGEQRGAVDTPSDAAITLAVVTEPGRDVLVVGT